MTSLPSPADPAVLLLLVLLFLAAAVLSQAQRFDTGGGTPRRRRPRPDSTSPHPCRGRKKPDWVRREVARLAALNPRGSCRKIAATFCAKFYGVESVGRTWVAVFLRDEKHRIEATRREIRNRRPRAMPRNRIWALDLTSVPNDVATRLALGIVDHGTRACIALHDLPSKHSFRILAHVATAVRRYGKPAAIRTDNEAIFTSRLFCVGLWLLGITHQQIEKLAPWQNGRIERFFGSFKAAWSLFRGQAEPAVVNVQAELDVFRAWHNHVRPHMHLGGRVPADVWDGRRAEVDRPYDYFSEWEEVLTGFHFR